MVAQKKKQSVGDELVEVQLFYDSDKYKEPVPVIVNGVKMLVPRGKRVKIKRKFAQVLEHSVMQDQAAGLLQSKLSGDFERESEARKIEV